MFHNEKPTSEDGHAYVRLPSEPPPPPPLVVASQSFRELPGRVFDELPQADIVSVSRPDASDITPMLLSYTIELRYKQFKWRIVKKASQVLYLHLALKKRALLKEFHEKQEQVKEWLQNLGLWEHPPIIHDDDEADVLEEDNYSLGNSNVPSSAALSIIRPALGSHQHISDKAKAAMQGYLNHFLGNLDIVNSKEVCKFLEVSTLSFCPEYGPKLKEGYVTVRHVPKIQNKDDDSSCNACCWFNCCNNSWQKAAGLATVHPVNIQFVDCRANLVKYEVWAVLKPGFLALLEDPLDTKLLDIIVFDVLATSDGKDQGRRPLAKQTKGRNPLRLGFEVYCGSRTIQFRIRSHAKIKDWVSAVNDTVLQPPEGWCYPHRFGSFAPPRGLTEDDSHVQWFVDGQAAFEAIASSIEQAKSEIFITGWWLCPELYLRRPFNVHRSSGLETMLEAKAKQGVQIYILLYKEVSIALKINSEYSKRRLLNIHENVKVLRYPDHFSTGVYLWSHHEKIVIVDNQICFIGGLDLCFGRYDNFEHKVGDLPPLVWPGKDYYNARESEPNSWEDTMTDELDRGKYPRMPWHDVQCALWGPSCRDVARHFVRRWNFAKRNKAPNVQAIPLLMPQQHMVIPHYMGGNKEVNAQNKEEDGKLKNVKKLDSFPKAKSCQDIPLLSTQELDGPTVANGNAKVNELDRIHGISNLPNGINHSQAFSFRKPRVEHSVQDTQMNGFVDELGSPQLQRHKSLDVSFHPSVQNMGEDWWEGQERGNQVVSAEEARQVGPRTLCRCQIVRSVGQWSAGTSQNEDSIQKSYISLIEKAEHFIYIENQFFISGLSGDDIIKNRVLEALYQRIMRAKRERKPFRVIIVIPLLPGFQGGMDDNGAASVRAIMHWQYRTICRGSNSILHNLRNVIGPNVDDFISFYGLRAHGRLGDGGQLVTNQVYVHSKLMIIDDRMTLIGSANINDRSLLGSRDSEIGVIIEDKEFVDSYMDGSPWKAGKFSLSLRLSLWMEHLGLRAGEVIQIKDPVDDTAYKDIWMAIAETNTAIYQDVFSCVPNDVIRSRTAFRQSTNYWKEKLGYTTIDLGVAPDELNPCQNGVVKSSDPIERLKSVRGHLVQFPLHFMCNEDLRPNFSQGEFYVSPHVFH